MSTLHWIVNSAALGCDTDVMVALPRVDRPQYDPWQELPAASNTQFSAPPGVLYLLHGLTDNYSAWSRYADVEALATKYNLAIVMPNGGRSFWLDEHHGRAYFTWIAEELPQLVETTFQVDTRRERTLIAGLSMGGYGAFLTALRRPEKYGAAGAFSGVLDIAAASNRSWYPELIQNSLASDAANADEDLLELLRYADTDKLPYLWVRCGTDDELLEHSRHFVEVAHTVSANISYEEQPGGHEWALWRADLAEFLAAAATQLGW